MMGDYRVTHDKYYYEITSIDGEFKKFVREKVEQLARELEISKREATILKFIIFRAESCSTSSLGIRRLSNDKIISVYKPVMDMINLYGFENFIEWLEEQPIQVVHSPEEPLLNDWS